MTPLATSAVYENGVFRPTTPISLREGERVEIVIHPARPEVPEEEMARRRRVVEKLHELDALADQEPDDGYDLIAEINAERLRIGARPIIPPDEGSK
jgi:predicted DNA-binding antitoxin AbrB/MazE fold protein